MGRCVGWTALFAIGITMLASPAMAGSNNGNYVGKYAGESQYGKIKFTVKKRGKLITRFGATVTAACYSPISGLRLVPVIVGIDRIKVKGTGKFAKSVDLGDDETGPYQSYTVSGKLKGNRVRNGRIKVRGRCSAANDFVAKRKG